MTEFLRVGAISAEIDEFSGVRIKFSLKRFSDPSRYNLRAEPLKNSAGRVPQAAD